MIVSIGQNSIPSNVWTIVTRNELADATNSHPSMAVPQPGVRPVLEGLRGRWDNGTALTRDG